MRFGKILKIYSMKKLSEREMKHAWLNDTDCNDFAEESLKGKWEKYQKKRRKKQKSFLKKHYPKML
jgi:hypothetical protein